MCRHNTHFQNVFTEQSCRVLVQVWNKENSSAASRPQTALYREGSRAVCSAGPVCSRPGAQTSSAPIAASKRLSKHNQKLKIIWHLGQRRRIDLWRVVLCIFMFLSVSTESSLLFVVKAPVWVKQVQFMLQQRHTRGVVTWFWVCSRSYISKKNRVPKLLLTRVCSLSSAEFGQCGWMCCWKLSDTRWQLLTSVTLFPQCDEAVDPVWGSDSRANPTFSLVCLQAGRDDCTLNPSWPWLLNMICDDAKH